MRKLLNLEDIKVVDINGKTRFDNRLIAINDEDMDLPITAFAAKVKESLDIINNPFNSNTITIISIDCSRINYADAEDPNDLAIADFMGLARTITALFFDSICTDEKREREARLDVPDDLAASVHMSLGALKDAINYQTTIDNFNLVIKGFFEEPVKTEYLDFYLVTAERSEK